MQIYSVQSKLTSAA